jgi:hypothetical protein
VRTDDSSSSFDAIALSGCALGLPRSVLVLDAVRC